MPEGAADVEPSVLVAKLSECLEVSQRATLETRAVLSIVRASAA